MRWLMQSLELRVKLDSQSSSHTVDTASDGCSTVYVVPTVLSQTLLRIHILCEAKVIICVRCVLLQAPNVPHYAKNKAVGMMKKGWVAIVLGTLVEQI